MLKRLAVVAAACFASATAFTAPVGITRSSGVLARGDAFATKRALPTAAPVERANALDSLQMACTTKRTTETRQQPHRKKCMLLNKIANNGMTVSFSHRREHKLQQVNLHWKRVWWEEGKAFVKLRLSAKAIKALKTKSLAELAKKAGLDLNEHKISSGKAMAAATA